MPPYPVSRIASTQIVLPGAVNRASLNVGLRYDIRQRRTANRVRARGALLRPAAKTAHAPLRSRRRRCSAYGGKRLIEQTRWHVSTAKHYAAVYGRSTLLGPSQFDNPNLPFGGPKVNNMEDCGFSAEGEFRQDCAEQTIYHQVLTTLC